MTIEDTRLLPVIKHEKSEADLDIWTTLKKMFKSSSDVSIDDYLAQYQSITMGPTETNEIRKPAERARKQPRRYRHNITVADKHRTLLRGLENNFAVTAEVPTATDKEISEAVAMLVVRETNNISEIHSEHETSSSALHTPTETCENLAAVDSLSFRCGSLQTGRLYAGRGYF